MNVSLNDIVAQHDTNWIAAGEMFDQRQRCRDSALAFLIGVVQMLQSECLAVTQQFEKIAGRISACDDHDVRNAGVDQRLNRIVNHRLIEDGQQMFVGHGRQRPQTATRSTRENDTFHANTSIDKFLKP